MTEKSIDFKSVLFVYILEHLRPHVDIRIIIFNIIFISADITKPQILAYQAKAIFAEIWLLPRHLLVSTSVRDICLVDTEEWKKEFVVANAMTGVVVNPDIRDKMKIRCFPMHFGTRKLILPLQRSWFKMTLAQAEGNMVSSR